jgi:hypothetical protein
MSDVLAGRHIHLLGGMDAGTTPASVRESPLAPLTGAILLDFCHYTLAFPCQLNKTSEVWPRKGHAKTTEALSLKNKPLSG